MDDACARISGSNDALDSFLDAMVDYLHDNKLIPYSDDDNGDEWSLADVPMDSHADIQAMLRRVFDATRHLCYSSNDGAPGDGSGVFSLALQSLNAFTEADSLMVFKPQAWERVRVGVETAAASLPR